MDTQTRLTHLLEYTKKRPQPLQGQTLTFFLLTTSFCLNYTSFLGPLREEKTKERWSFDQAGAATWDGATVVIRPPTDNEIQWAAEELERMSKV